MRPYWQESKLKGLARSLQSLSLTAAMGNAFRTEVCCLMGRLPDDRSEASFFELWLRPWCLPQLLWQAAALNAFSRNRILTYRDLSCQVWVLTVTFWAFRGGAV